MDTKYFAQNILMAEIAKEIMKQNFDFFNVDGIKELICLYLLLPYINPDSLKYDSNHKALTIYSDEEICFDNIKMRNLRNTLSHSFLGLELKDAHGWKENGLVFDDRILFDSKEEHPCGTGAKVYPVSQIRKFINDSIEKIFNKWTHQKK